MIICRTPMRVSFVGGGSDLPSFYRQHQGSVVSTSIDKYMYITLKNKFDTGIRASYSVTEEVDDLTDLKHPLIKAAFQVTGIKQGVELASMADVPKGTGLGSSSSFTVSLLHALNALNGKVVTAEYLASEASRIEIDICKEPIGKQDQYAAAYGGLNQITFHEQDSVTVNPVVCKQVVHRQLNDHLMLIYTGQSRSASTVLATQNKRLMENRDAFNLTEKMMLLCNPFLETLRAGDMKILGEILSDSWEMKRRISDSISNSKIDDQYERAMKAGAYGGKLLGAGNGGFLMFLVAPELQQDVRNTIGGTFREMPTKLSQHGSQIIFYNATDAGTAT